MGAVDNNKQILSSLHLQVLLYFHSYYTVCYFFLSCALLIYKNYKYFYPNTALALEIIMLCFIALIEAPRLFLASKGNKTEQIPPLVWAFGLGIPTIVGYSFFAFMQTYVLRQ